MLKVVVDHDLKPEQIRAVRLRAGSNILEPLRYKVAKTELEGKFSIPFLLSSIIIRRKAGIREFTDEFVASEPVQRMMPRVTGVFDEKIEAQGFDKIRSIVEVDLNDGRTSQPRRSIPWWTRAPFTREELHEKFSDSATGALREQGAAGAHATGVPRHAEGHSPAGENAQPQSTDDRRLTTVIRR